MNRSFLFSCLAFGTLNFIGLAIGGMATGPGVVSDWYASLEKAPWTPSRLGFWCGVDFGDGRV